MSTDVVVVTGVGGIGQAIARRQGFGTLVLLADFHGDTLKAAATGLETTGLRRIQQVFPAGAAVGERYPESTMRTLNR